MFVYKGKVSSQTTWECIQDFTLGALSVTWQVAFLSQRNVKKERLVREHLFITVSDNRK